MWARKNPGPRTTFNSRTAEEGRTRRSNALLCGLLTPRARRDALGRQGELVRLDDPFVIAFRDYATDAILGAALTCRSRIAASTLVAQRRGRRVPPAFDYTSVLSKHSELDLISVIPSARNRSIGSEMLNYLEQELQSRGTRIWFGHVTSDLNTGSPSHVLHRGRIQSCSDATG
jgi:ribosomal protein S18 acetylase RimI-like enzyme